MATSSLTATPTGRLVVSFQPIHMRIVKKSCVVHHRPMASRTPNPIARTASEAVAEDIRAQIATGRLQAGDRLPSETSLLQVYDVARSTMREALRILESDRLVVVERGT